MGFLSSLFGSDGRDPSEVQLELAEVYVLEAMGVPNQEAKQMAAETLQKAKEVVRQRQQEHEPRGLGDLLLGREATDPAVRERLQVVRREGVTDDDIKDWWNRSPLERAMMELKDEQTRMALFVAALQRGASPDESARAARRQPEFGTVNPTKGDDGPIPWELRARITRWNEDRGRTQDMVRQIEQSSSFNAIVRDEIRNGRL